MFSFILMLLSEYNYVIIQSKYLVFKMKVKNTIVEINKEEIAHSNFIKISIHRLFWTYFCFEMQISNIFRQNSYVQLETYNNKQISSYKNVKVMNIQII